MDSNCSRQKIPARRPRECFFVAFSFVLSLSEQQTRAKHAKRLSFSEQPQLKQSVIVHCIDLLSGPDSTRKQSVGAAKRSAPHCFKLRTSRKAPESAQHPTKQRTGASERVLQRSDLWASCNPAETKAQTVQRTRSSAQRVNFVPIEFQ